VTILRPDPTSNRSAGELTWTPDGKQVVVIVERKETGGVRGDVFAIAVEGGPPTLVWSSGPHTMDSGAEHISLSPDGSVLAVVTRDNGGASVLVLKQFGGPSEVRRNLTVPINEARVVWSDQGLIVVGVLAGEMKDRSSKAIAVLVDESGQVHVPELPATPEASPVPVASPPLMASPPAAATPATPAPSS